MLKRCSILAAVLSLLVVSLSAGSRLAAENVVEELAEAARTTATALDDLVNSAPTKSVELMKQALRSDEVQALLAAGLEADRQRVEQIVVLYGQPLEGLKKAKKYATRVAVIRAALRDWLAMMPEMDLSEVLAMIKSERPAFRPVSSEQAAAARATVQQKWQAADAYLKQNPASGDTSWEDHMAWSTSKQLLDADEPSLRDLQRLSARLHMNIEGLEAESLLEFRVALNDFMNAHYFATNGNTEKMYDQQITLLVEKLETYLADPNNDDAWAIGRLIGWLDRAQQAPLVRAMVRREFSQPNLHLQASQNLLAAGEPIIVDDTTEVKEVMLGANVAGVAETKGRVDMQLTPHPDRIALKVKLRGITIVNSVATAIGVDVQVLSQATTDVRAEQTILFGPAGITSLPASAKCTSSVKILDITASSPGYETIARKRTTKNKAKAEELTSQRAEAIVKEKMDNQSGEMLDKVAEGYANKFRLPLIRKGGFPEQMLMSTTSDNVLAGMLQRKWNQVAAFIPAPALSGDHDLSVRVHESFVRNFSEATIGGFTLTDEKLEQVMQELGAEIPEELRTEGKQKSWSITFSSNQPVSLKVLDGKITLAIRGRQFTDGERVIRDTIQISATYAIQKTESGRVLVREGDVAVDFVGRTRLTAAQIAARTVMRRKFSALFNEEINGSGFKLPGRWEGAGVMQISQLMAEKGWLLLGWKLSEAGVRTAELP